MNIYKVLTNDPKFYFTVEANSVLKATEKAEERLASYNEQRKKRNESELEIRTVSYYYTKELGIA